MRRSSPLLVWVALCWGLRAAAEPDAFGLGDGHHGARTVSTPDTQLNAYAAMLADVSPGASQLLVSTTAGFAVGDLVMVLQSAVELPPDADAGPTLELAQSSIGRWELGRVASIEADRITLTRPLEQSFTAAFSQVVTVPELTSLIVKAGATVVAAPWNGASGGVVAFLADGTVTLDGDIIASARGFRGGALANATAQAGDCTLLDEANANGGGAKGEGAFIDRFSSGFGRGRRANGGGGGNCENAGGGGGGHGRPGGSGSLDVFGAGVGGQGGAQLQYPLATRLVFGGGGGAGHANDFVGSAGASGGGAVFFRARRAQGMGAVRADGASAGGGGDDGMGGGGAGGAVYLRAAETVALGGISANGGTGGTSVWPVNIGPGGGGAGGRVLLQASDAPVVVTARGGAAGRTEVPDGGGPLTQVDGGDAHFGATPPVGSTALDVMLETLPGGFRVPSAPVITAPEEGAAVAELKPTLAGGAEAGATVWLKVDGRRTEAVIAGADGRFQLSWPVDLEPGAHAVIAWQEVQLVASPRTGERRFTAGEGTLSGYAVPCRCAAAPGALGLALAVLALRRALESVRQRHKPDGGAPSRCRTRRQNVE